MVCSEAWYWKALLSVLTSSLCDSVYSGFVFVVHDNNNGLFERFRYMILLEF